MHVRLTTMLYSSNIQILVIVSFVLDGFFDDAIIEEIQTISKMIDNVNNTTLDLVDFY